MEIIYAIVFVMGMFTVATEDPIPQAQYAAKHQSKISIRTFSLNSDQAKIARVHSISLIARTNKSCLYKDIGQCMLDTLDKDERPMMTELIIDMQKKIDRQAKSSAGNGYNPRRSIGYIHPQSTINTEIAFLWIANNTE